MPRSGIGYVAIHIVKLRGHLPQWIYLLGRSPQYLLCRKLGGPCIQSGCCEEEEQSLAPVKIKFMLEQAQRQSRGVALLSL
jgi:hypothetical protein